MLADTPATAYYLHDTTGWGVTTYAGRQPQFGSGKALIRQLLGLAQNAPDSSWNALGNKQWSQGRDYGTGFEADSDAVFDQIKDVAGALFLRPVIGVVTRVRISCQISGSEWRRGR